MRVLKCVWAVEVDGNTLGGTQYMEGCQEEQVVGMTEWGEQEMKKEKKNKWGAEAFPEERKKKPWRQKKYRNCRLETDTARED